jgi:RNA polymerase sigma factor (sigma-70 family)
MVLGVCRRTLGDLHAAEDACQAVFLVLARKAASLTRPGPLAGWLHEVARRVALKARATNDGRGQQLPGGEAALADRSRDPLADLSGRELLAILEEEIHRLPTAYRLPVALCCLEGLSQEEASRRLAWTVGAVRGRLERGRARLRRRLVRRGLTLSAVLAAAEISKGMGSAAALARLVAPTAQAAMVFAIGKAPVWGVSAQVLALAAERTDGIALGKLKVGVLLTIGFLAAGYFAHRPADSFRMTAAESLSSLTVDKESQNGAQKIDPNMSGPRPKEAMHRIDVRGRVFDPTGSPIAGARLYVGYSVRRPVAEGDFREMAYPIRATSSAGGQFHFTFDESELDARWLDDSRPAVIAVVGKYGPDWAEIPESGEGGEITLRLVEDLPITGRILDQNRKPATGARISVREVMSDSEERVTRYLRRDVDPWYPRRWRGAFPEQRLGATLDVDGQFRLTGLGRNRIVSLALDGPAIRHTTLTVVTRAAEMNPGYPRVNGASFEYTAAPSQVIRGVVRDKTTGKPLAGVKTWVLPNSPPAVTDEKGRFEILGCPKMPQGYTITAQPQSGQPYFVERVSVSDVPGFGPVTVDVNLTGGISLTGHVIDQATGKPPRAAVVDYYPLFPNPHSAVLTLCSAQAASSGLVRSDGSYSLVVLPGPGVVCVGASPRNSYAGAAVDDKELASFFHDDIKRGMGQYLFTDVGIGRPELLRVNKYNILSPINPGEQAESLALNLTLRAARTVQGTVVGPDGKPLIGAEVVGLTALPNDEMLESATFAVTGLSPHGVRHLSFRDAGSALGKSLTIRGDINEPLTVVLEPCGSVVGRLVDESGSPMTGVTVNLGGSDTFGITTETDHGGRFRSVVLPGQKYSLWLSNSRRLLKEVGQVEAKSGQTKDLGDLRLAD